MDAMSKSHRGVVLPPTIDDLSLSIFIILYPYYHAVPYYMVQHDRDKNKFSTTPSNGSTGSTKIWHAAQPAMSEILSPPGCWAWSQWRVASCKLLQTVSIHTRPSRSKTYENIQTNFTAPPGHSLIYPNVSNLHIIYMHVLHMCIHICNLKVGGSTQKPKCP